MLCAKTVASVRYRRDVQLLMAGYVGVLFLSSWMMKHHVEQGWWRYFWAVLPAVPILAVIVRMGVYLREETDEYVRLVRMRTILAGTGALLAGVTVSDFLRAFAHAPGFPPFVLFVIFGLAMGVMELMQWLRDRKSAEA